MHRVSFLTDRCVVILGRRSWHSEEFRPMARVRESLEVEAGVLGGLLNRPELADRCWGEGITPEHFGGDLHVLACVMFSMWQQRRSCDPMSVVLALTEDGSINRFGGAAVFKLYQDGLATGDFDSLVRHLDEQAQRRKITELATRMVQIASVPGSDFALGVQSIQAEITSTISTTVLDPLAGSATLREVLTTDYASHGDVIPGLLRNGSRAVITGPEGMGKSEFLYQLAVCAGMGVHPFTLRPMPRVRVLVVDAENEMADLKVRLNRMVGCLANLSPQAPDIRIQYANGWSLLDPRDAGHLFGMVRSYLPDLLFIGPVYQIMDGDQNEAEVTRRFMRVVDECRRIAHCAVICEAHANNEYQGKRDWRPSGSSYWRRWPEFGIGLDPDKGRNGTMTLIRWRGDRVAAQWPDRITRGGLMPWEECG